MNSEKIVRKCVLLLQEDRLDDSIGAQVNFTVLETRFKDHEMDDPKKAGFFEFRLRDNSCKTGAWIDGRLMKKVKKLCRGSSVWVGTSADEEPNEFLLVVYGVYGVKP